MERTAPSRVARPPLGSHARFAEFVLLFGANAPKSVGIAANSVALVSYNST